MNTSLISSAEHRLIGQQLSSVLTAIDYITLKFVKYPLSSNSEFSDSALLDIEEGFELETDEGRVVVRKDEGLDKFRNSAAGLLYLIGQQVTDAKSCPNGELELQFGLNAKLHVLISKQGFDSFDLTFKR